MMQNKKKLILFVNLGSPENPNSKDIRKYLREFLSDNHVIDLNPILWKTVLNCFILPFRPKKLVPLYKSIWKNDRSPLHYYTEQQLAIAKKYASDDNIEIDFVMRYGKPSINSKLEYCRKNNINDVIIVPLFPQYSNTTSGSIIDKSNEIIVPFRENIFLHFFPEFYDKAFFYVSIAKKIIKAHQQDPFDFLLLSYHGLPKRYADLGDPYYKQCLKTTELISSKLSELKVEIKTVFQSRFGKEEWLKPYCDVYVEELAKKGVKSIAIHSPSFVSDCLETVSELGEEVRDVFIENGGEKFTFIESLNDNEDFVAGLTKEITSRFQLN